MSNLLKAQGRFCEMNQAHPNYGPEGLKKKYSWQGGGVEVGERQYQQRDKKQ